MYNCCICGVSIHSQKAYVVHCKLHRNEPRCIFKCVAIGCKLFFSRYAAFKSHFYRHHNGASSAVHDVALATLKCTVSPCETQCDGVKELVHHLKQHIVEGRPVNCPVRGCKTVFTVKSSFTSHMSRKHRQCSANMICGTLQDKNPECPSTSEQRITDCTIEATSSVSVAEDTIGDMSNFSDLYLRNVCMFYTKLQGQNLVPASTIQNIVEEIQNIHELGQTYTLNRLKLVLKELSVSDEDIVKICDTVKESDLFSACHTGPMRTAYSRARCFKEMFKYVEPKRVFLGRDENRTERFAYYVPVLDALKSMLESDFWQGLMSEDPNDVTNPDVLCDSCDGQVFKSNTFFQENRTCLKLVLYQDAFEVVNPLGSAKKKHKIFTT